MTEAISPIKGTESIRFLKDYRCFKKGDEFEFRPGLNLLVGDQGVGKSSLLDLLTKHGRDGKELTISVVCRDTTRLRAFDFEKGNPRILPLGGRDGNFSVGIQAKMMFSSHGETHRAILNSSMEHEQAIVLLDEPDTSLSIRSCHALCGILDKLVEQGCQVVAGVHRIASRKPLRRSR